MSESQAGEHHAGDARPGGGRSGGGEEGRRYPSTIGGACYIGVLVAVLAGLVVVATGHWKAGIELFGGALVAASAFRLVLRSRDAGMLAVRSRWLDAALLAGTGAALWLLAASIPTATP